MSCSELQCVAVSYMCSAISVASTNSIMSFRSCHTKQVSNKGISQPTPCNFILKPLHPFNNEFPQLPHHTSCVIIAVCCSVLQCVAVSCMYHHAFPQLPHHTSDTHYSALQCVAVRCSALQCVAVRCSALQCVAVRCSVLPYMRYA